MDAKERRLEAMTALIGCKIGNRDKQIRKQHFLESRVKARPIASLKTLRYDNVKNKANFKSCLNKKAYKTQGDATRQLHMDEQRYGKTGRVYYCENCHRYHLTFHKPRH